MGHFFSKIQVHFSRKIFPPRLISARIFFSLHSNSNNQNEENGNLGGYYKCLLFKTPSGMSAKVLHFLHATTSQHRKKSIQKPKNKKHKGWKGKVAFPR